MKRFIFVLSLCSLHLISAADPCLSIQEITCGITYGFSVSGAGDPAYPTGMNGLGCSSANATQGGQERVYRFVVPSTGTYQLNSISSSANDFVDYYYKRNSTDCSNTGWICIRPNLVDNAPLGAFNWNEGDVILLLLNAENVGTTTHSFRINCATTVCSSVTSISCGETVNFTASGYGDPNYPIGMNGLGCNSATPAQGGQEKVYSFRVPSTGTYQLNSIESSANDFVDYYYKRNNTTCSNSDWTCIKANLSDNALLGTFNWNQGDVILLLLNAENASSTTQSFRINCPGVLPLTLISFDVLGSGTANKLYWTTASQTNTDYFSIQHSSDGKNFIEISRIKASNSNDATVKYELTDAANRERMNYYRLKIVDNNGEYSYSKIIAINLNQKGSLAIYPNPAREVLNIQVYRKKAETAIVQIAYLEGRILNQVSKRLEKGLNALSVNTSVLSKGKYILIVKGDETEQKIFVKH